MENNNSGMDVMAEAFAKAMKKANPETLKAYLGEDKCQRKEESASTSVETAA
jgi:hypothetical protein